MNLTPDTPRVAAAVESPEDPWLEVVRRHEAFLARRRAAAAGDPGAESFVGSLLWSREEGREADPQDQAA